MTETNGPCYQAYQILHWGFTVAPILAGVDKFFHMLTNWDQYLAGWIPTLLHLGAHQIMAAVGVIEIIAGIVVAITPRIGSWIVFGWLWAIIFNLITGPGYYDVALRDFSLSLGALSLARLSALYDPAHLARTMAHI